MYLPYRSRPVLAMTVSLIGEFQNDLASQDWKSLKHVVWYVNLTANYGLHLPKGRSRREHVVNSDADWGRDLEKRPFRAGYMPYHNSAPILWRSKLQSATATFTCLAELSALSDCIKDFLWVREILSNIVILIINPTTVY